MVLFRASDAETPISSPPSFSCSSESTINLPPMVPATPLSPSFVNNLSLSRLNQANSDNLTIIDNLNRLVHHPADVSGNNPFVSTCSQPLSNPTTQPFSDPLSPLGETRFQSPRPQPFSNPTDHVLGRTQSVLSTQISSVDLERNLSELILSEHTHDVQGNNQSDLFANEHLCFSVRPSVNASYSYGANGVSPNMRHSSATGNSSMLMVPSYSHDHQITGKSDQSFVDDSDDGNTKAMLSLVVEKPLVGGASSMSEETVEASLLSEKHVRGTHSMMLGELEETQSPPATKHVMGSAGSVKNSKKQGENHLKLKLVLPLRSHKTGDGVQANEADVSDAKKSAVNDEGTETDQPERKSLNLRSRGAMEKAKNIGSNGQESRIQTRSQTEKQVKLAPSKFSLTLTKEEIEADFLAMTGSKPPKKPKKRAKNLQRQLDRKFPGLCLGNVSTEAYDQAPEHPLKG